MNKTNQLRTWIVEFVFYGSPLQSNHPREQSNKRTLHLSYEQINNCVKTVEDLLNDWSKIVYLYIIVFDFSKDIKYSMLICMTYIVI